MLSAAASFPNTPSFASSSGTGSVSACTGSAVDNTDGAAVSRSSDLPSLCVMLLEAPRSSVKRCPNMSSSGSASGAAVGTATGSGVGFVVGSLVSAGIFLASSP